MPDYKSVNVEFALGVLQLRQALAQKEVEFQELRKTRQVQAALEHERNMLQAAGIAQQGAQASADRQMRGQIAVMETETRRAADQAQIEIERNRMEREDEGALSSIANKISSGEGTFVPFRFLSQIPQEALQGPTATNPDGTQAPLHPMGRFTVPGKGEFIFPLADAKQELDYARSLASLGNLKSDAVLKAMRRQKLELEIRAVEEGKLPPASAAAILRTGMEAYNERISAAISLARARGATQEMEAIKANPANAFKEGPERDNYIRQAITFTKMMDTAGSSFEKLAPSSNPNAPPLEALRYDALDALEREEAVRRAVPEDAPLPPEDQWLAKNKARRGFAQFGTVDISQGIEKAAFSPSDRKAARKSLGKGRGYGYIIPYESLDGQQLGYDMFSEGNRFVRSEGMTPRSAFEGGAPAAPAPRAPAPMTDATVPIEGRGPLDRAAVESEARRLADEIERNPTDPTNSQRVKRLVELKRLLDGKK